MSRFLAAFVLLLLAINAPFIAGGEDIAGPLLELDRAAFARGEIWRFVTGHLVHFTPAHAALDLGTLLVLLPLTGARRAALVLPAALVASSVVVVIAGPDVFRGSSVLAVALFTCAACRALAEQGAASRLLGLAGLAAVLGKIAVEALTGEAVFLGPGAWAGQTPPPPVALAHLAGFWAGLLAAVPARTPPATTALAPRPGAPVRSRDGPWWQ